MGFDDRVVLHRAVTHPPKQEEEVEDKAAGFQCNQAWQPEGYEPRIQ